jgi:hypothetical protein
MPLGTQSRPNSAQLERAIRLLAHEGAAAGAGEPATTAAGRVYDKLHAQLAPLVGAAGVQLLFVRSAKLRSDEFPWLADFATVETVTKLRESLHARDPAVDTGSAAELFGTFFALISTFIGVRLMTHVLRRAWPTIEEMALTETDT